MRDDFSDAMELFTGEELSQEKAERAVKIFERASAAGDGNATERLALIEAMGMLRPQDWNRALALLERAAQQGSRSAQQQLLLLSDNTTDPQMLEPAGADIWSELRAAISVEQRTDPGAKIFLSDEPRIQLIRGFATPAECRWLIGLAAGKVTRATVFDEATGQQIRDPARDNTHLDFRFADLNVVTEVIRARIARATRLPVPLFDAPQVLHYSVGQQFKPHYDFLDPTNPAYRANLGRFGQRIATFLVYLNDGYEGGETSFPRIGRRTRLGLGDALFWANVRRDGSPDLDTLHAGLPPISGEKWVFSQWIRDKLPGR